MYEPSVVLAAVKKLLKSEEFLAKYDLWKDKEDLLELERVGELAAEVDGILRISFG